MTSICFRQRDGGSCGFGEACFNDVHITPTQICTEWTMHGHCSTFKWCQHSHPREAKRWHVLTDQEKRRVHASAVEAAEMASRYMKEREEAERICMQKKRIEEVTRRASKTAPLELFSHLFDTPTYEERMRTVRLQENVQFVEAERARGATYLERFLDAQDLSKYLDMFLHHGITVEKLRSFQDDDFRAIGMKVGPRLKIKKALRTWQ